jgi:hypothetical protein
MKNTADVTVDKPIANNYEEELRRKFKNIVSILVCRLLYTVYINDKQEHVNNGAC